MKYYNILTLCIFSLILLFPPNLQAKQSLVVKDVTPKVGVSRQMASALSDVIKDTLSKYYSVQSLDALAAVNVLVEEKLKAGCDDTKCIMEVAGAMDIGKVVTGNISKFGGLYRMPLMLISSRGSDAGVIKRALEECECTEKELVGFAKRVSLKLIGKEPRVAATTTVKTEPQLRESPRETRSQFQRGESFTNSIGQKFVYIEPGTFMMGSPSNEPDRDKDETKHRVTLTKGFYMQTTEVTQGQWKAVMGTKPWSVKTYVREGDNYPATYVSWNDAQEFIKKLSRKEGTSKYRLLTEAEWEYACRAGSKTAYSFGESSSSLGDYAWYIINAYNIGEKYAHKAGQKMANAWGLYDMHGNVYEWCQDWKGSYPSGSVTDPEGHSSGSSRVSRGGGWDGYARYCRSARRDGNSPGIRGRSIGFRLTRTE